MWGGDVATGTYFGLIDVIIMLLLFTSSALIHFGFDFGPFGLLGLKIGHASFPLFILILQ